MLKIYWVAKKEVLLINRYFNVLIGSTWIVLTTDSEGFVPLTFGSMQEIIIRDASSKGYSTHSSKTLDIISSTEGYRPISSESLDITSSLEVLREHSSKSLDTSSSSEQSTSKTWFWIKMIVAVIVGQF